MVVKKDGAKETFDRQKVMNGLLRATVKRNITVRTLNGLIDSIETELRDNGVAEVSSQEIGSMDSTSIVNDLKLMLDETQNMTDEELRAQIVQIAAEYGYTLTDEMIDRLISLCRSLEGLSIAELTDKVEQFKSGIETVRKYAGTVQEYAQKATTFGQKVANFFQSIGDFFSRLFGKG